MCARVGKGDREMEKSEKMTERDGKSGKMRERDGKE
jgi:hypothetical protein